MPTILLVEDDAVSRMIVRDALHASGFRVLSVGDGHDALLCLETFTVDLVLLDLLMPRMDGVRFLAHRSTNPELAETPVVVVSAAPDAVDRIPAGTVSAIFVKPLHLAELVEVVESLCPRVPTRPRQ